MRIERGDIDLVDPINWDHPLNKGLLRRWIGLPQRSGGRTWYDACRNDPATVANAAFPATATSGWSPSTRGIASRNELRLDGTDDVATATCPFATGATKVSYSGWVYRSATNVRVAFGLPNGTTAGGNRFSIEWYTDGNVYAPCESGGLQYASFALAGTGWYKLLVTFDGAGATNAARLAIYLNGKPMALSFTNTMATSITTGTALWTVGRASSDAIDGGSYEDLCVWNRVISQAEAPQLYLAQSQQFDPTLNWTSVMPVMGASGFSRRLIDGGMTYSPLTEPRLVA